MTLLKQTSERVDNHGKAFVDYYLAWVYENKVYCVRVRPQFFNNAKLLFSNAVNVPIGEPLEKYVD